MAVAVFRVNRFCIVLKPWQELSIFPSDWFHIRLFFCCIERDKVSAIWVCQLNSELERYRRFLFHRNILSNAIQGACKSHQYQERWLNYSLLECAIASLYLQIVRMV